VTAARSAAAVLALVLAIALSAAAQNTDDPVTPGQRELFHLRDAQPIVPP